MPGQSRTPQKQGPGKGPQSAKAPAGAAQSNADAQSMLPQVDSVDDAQGLLRDKTDTAGVSVGGELPGGLVLGDKGGDRLATGQPTHFSAGVDRFGIWARFSPPLQVTPGSFWSRMATGGVTVSSLYFSFRSGKADLTLDTGLAGDVLDVFMDFKDLVEGKFATAIEGVLPARIRTPGYDPYTDPDIAGLLQSVVGAMGTAMPKDGAPSQGPSLTDRITKPTVSARVSPKPLEVKLDDKMVLKIEPGASVELTANLKGTLKDALSTPKVASLLLSTSEVSIEHEVAGKLAGIDIRSARFGADLSLESLDYALGLETGLGALKALGALFQIHTGTDLGIRDLNSPELPSIRAMVDEKARAKVPDLLRDMVRQNDKAIPGVDLTDLFEGV